MSDKDKVDSAYGLGAPGGDRKAAPTEGTGPCIGCGGTMPRPSKFIEDEGWLHHSCWMDTIQQMKQLEDEADQVIDGILNLDDFR